VINEGKGSLECEILVQEDTVVSVTQHYKASDQRVHVYLYLLPPQTQE